MKKITIFLTAMLTMVMATGVVFGASITRERDVDPGKYSETVPGKYSMIKVSATVGSALMSVHNTSSEGFYLHGQVRERHYKNGFTSNSKSKEQEVNAKEYYFVGIPRDNEMKGYYYYLGKCMDSAHSPAVYDTLIFKGHQNMDR